MFLDLLLDLGKMSALYEKYYKLLYSYTYLDLYFLPMQTCVNFRNVQLYWYTKMLSMGMKFALVVEKLA